MANKYDAGFSEEFAVPSISREAIAWPSVSKALGSVRGKRILELGCGNGYWLRKLSRMGAICIGVDISPAQIALAKRMDGTNRIKFMVADALKAGELNSSFDIVLVMNVIVEMKGKRKVHTLFSTAHKLLKRNGRLLVLDMHPMAPSMHGGFRLPPGYGYFKSGIVVQVESRKTDGKSIYYNDSHYTLQDFSDFFSRSGFLMRRIIEDRASAAVVRKHPEMSGRSEHPSDILIEGVKA